MNIATYNLRFGGKASQRVHWEKIFEAAAPDIFLVQEMCEPRLYLTSPALGSIGAERILWTRVANMAWGSAVFVRSGRMTPIEIEGYAGYVAGVEVSGPAWTDTSRLRVFSLHVPAPYKRPMNEILDRIAALPDAASCDHIIGGDFNLTTGVRHPTERRQVHDLWLLERLRKEFNLINCWQVANPNRNLPQTLRWGRDKTEPYHCDAIFVPACWYRHLDSCEVFSGQPWDALSDHYPVVARLALEV